SRRRHTRFSRDWSSDVCSSDLAESQQRMPIVVLWFAGTSPRRVIAAQRLNMGGEGGIRAGFLGRTRTTSAHPAVIACPLGPRGAQPPKGASTAGNRLPRSNSDTLLTLPSSHAH